MESIKQTKTYQPFIYIVTALLYTVRDSLFQGVIGNLIGRGIFALFFALSLYYFFKAIQLNHKIAVCRSLNLLVGLIMIYGILFSIVGIDSSWLKPSTPFNFLHSYLESILPIYAFYYFGREGWIDDTWFKWATIPFAVFAVYYFIQKQITTILLLDREDITNNASYMMVSLFPIFAFFRKKPVLFYSLMFLTFLVVVSGGKRGAILLGALCLLYSFFVLNREAKSWRKILVLVFFGAAMVVTWIYFDYMFQNDPRFSSRMLELTTGDVSNRKDQYPLFLSFYLNSNLFYFLFGHGADATSHYLGIMAHDDWLEFAINMGLVGVACLLIFWIRVVMFWLTTRRRLRPELVLAIGMFVIIYLGKTFFSMSIMQMSIVATPVFGYCLSVYDNYKKPVDQYAHN